MHSKVPSVNRRRQCQRRHGAAPFVLVSMAAVLAAAGPIETPQTGSRSVAVTVDDLPGVIRGGTLDDFRQANRQMLAALQAKGVPAIGFVNEGKLEVPGEREARIALLESWLDAGMTLGNHTYSHGGLTNTPVARYESDVLRGEAVTRPLLDQRGLALEFFRHPMTQTGPTREIKDRFDAFLSEHGYRTAPFTIEDADYMFALLYDLALNAGNTEEAARVLGASLEHQERMFDWFERLSRETFGREIPQILLIHVNRMNAAGLSRALDAMAARGYRFVSLETALADPAYDTEDGFIGRFGPSWLHRWRITLGLENRLRDEPDPPQWVLDEYQRATGG